MIEIPDGRLDRERKKKVLLNTVRVFFLLVAVAGLYSIQSSVSGFTVEKTWNGLNVSGGECYESGKEKVCYAPLEVMGADTGVPLALAVSNPAPGKGTLDYTFEIIDREW